MNALVTEILVYISSFPEHIETQAIFLSDENYKIKLEDDKA